MQLERIEADVRSGTFDLAGFARDLVLRLIDGELDLTEKKQRIMIAWEHGHLTAEEAEEWIVLGGMVEA
jgi:hypothetical protein